MMTIIIITHERKRKKGQKHVPENLQQQQKMFESGLWRKLKLPFFFIIDWINIYWSNIQTMWLYIFSIDDDDWSIDFLLSGTDTGNHSHDYLYMKIMMAMAAFDDRQLTFFSFISLFLCMYYLVINQKKIEPFDHHNNDNYQYEQHRKTKQNKNLPLFFSGLDEFIYHWLWLLIFSTTKKKQYQKKSMTFENWWKKKYSKNKKN